MQKTEEQIEEEKKEMRKVLAYSFIAGNFGNMSAYMRLQKEVPEIKELTLKDFETAFLTYYMIHPELLEKVGSAWLHNIHKNECKYDIRDTYNRLMLYMPPEL